jgi:hypothetical protein
MKRSQIATLVAIGLVLAYGGRLAWRAHRNIVSLSVHNMPVREVVKKLRWQTWESIVVNNNVDGRISLEVENQPLNGVLALIAEQCESRWSVAYPLYTTKAKLQLARKVAAGEYETPPEGWTNWNARPNFAAIAARMAAAADGSDTNAQPAAMRGLGGMGGGPSGMFGGGSVAAKPVTTDFSGQTPVEAALALRDFGPVKVVPEDGTERKVTLSLKEAPMDKAVAQLAKWVNRKWAKFYVIEPRFRPTQQDREQFAQMPRPDPEQMRQRMENFQPTPDMQQRATQRMLDRIKNSTPEQRAQRGGRGGFGGFGGGGGGGGGR